MRKILTIILSLVTGLSHGQSAQVVTDPTTYEHLIKHADTLDKMTTHTLQMRDRMHSMSNGIGSVLGAIQDLMRMGLLIAGKCGDPFADLAGQFLGLGKFGNLKFDFCNLVENRTAYDSLLFTARNLAGVPEQNQMRVEDVERQREQMIRESVTGTLSVTSMQKKEVIERRDIINQRMRDAMASKDLREDMRHNSILLSIIAQELTSIRILLIQQSEVQATTASQHVRLPY